MSLFLFKQEGAYSGQAAYDFNKFDRTDTHRSVEAREGRYVDRAEHESRRSVFPDYCRTKSKLKFRRRPLDIRNGNYDNYSAPRRPQALSSKLADDYSTSI